MIDFQDYVLNNFFDICSFHGQLKDQYLRQLKVTPSFADEIADEYVKVVKRQVINDYCKLTGRQYDLVVIESEEIDLKKLFW